MGIPFTHFWDLTNPVDDTTPFIVLLLLFCQWAFLGPSSREKN